MESLYSSIQNLGTNSHWLLAANAIVSGLLCFWMLRFRRLYRASIAEYKNQRDLIDNLSEGIYRSAPDGRQLSANKALVALNGYGTEAEILLAIRDIGKEWYVDPGRRDDFRAQLRQHGSVQDFVSEIYRHKTRERIWITESARIVYDDRSGKPLFYEGSVREITDLMKRLKVEEMLQKLSSRVPGGLFQLVRHRKGGFTVPYVSSGFRGISGFAESEPYPHPKQFIEMIHAEDRQRLIETLKRSGTLMEPWELEFRVTARDGKEKWLRLSAKPEAIDEGIIWHGYINDISIRKRNEMEIEKLAFFDSLTGLPNRRMFMDRMRRAVGLCRERKTCGALIFIDLDNFKTLNDTRGHDVGDQYLAQVGRRLRDCVRHEDTVARIGGDEFVIILEGVGADSSHGARAAIMTGNKVLAALRDDFEIGLFSHRSSASLGVVIFDGQEARPEEILKHADIAMYQAKAAGRNGMALYDHLSMSPESDRYRLLNEFKDALSGDALELYFQPQMDDVGRIVGAEALCRWHHPEFGTLLPERFVPLTEQFGLVREFGNLVLAKGVAELARWQGTRETAGLRLAINVNVQSFACDEFLSNLIGLIERHGVDPRLLTLELTESVMAKDRKLISRRMHELKQIGVRLSLDDFGSGYSSLAQLKRLPFDELKIDGSFIADIENGESDRALVKSILGTARTLKLTAVAEHVENVRQEAFLRAFGCDFFQGYLYSAALASDAFMEFVGRRHASEPDADLPETRRQLFGS
ncbi:EAL domain-containing protein [Mesorhizobium sp. CAU 1732]|uniref:putative bifunctional diguanylate cyclase/phosphodiesterase n=1 Tax=Mesorhizobium sp. CAU 1732 TaxID=3140358 RepID=UPI0032610FBE